ncbi:hypothetical protein [Streptomyces sp. NPDC008001]|uniref:hypothetical protein n=1 Tax=Streptomyces sp. NPDC008001 TaxID=3364804 RepID=UPI0036EDE9DB
MSEFQFYQFVATERPLRHDQLAEVRKLTTRARLTPTSFVNTYQFGDFKGSPEGLVADLYDGHLYFANWGTRRVILRWPAEQLPPEVAESYCTGPSATARRHGDQVLLTLFSDDEDGELDDFNDLFDFSDVDGDRGEQWLPSIARARPDVAAGDLRLLYLAWLLCLQAGQVDDEGAEPPLPAGLAELSDSLSDLAVFLRIDPDLITAAQPLPDLPPAPRRTDYAKWIRRLDATDKDTALTRLLHDNDQHVLTELRRRFHHDHPRPAPACPGRTAAELRAAVSDQAALRVAREQREAEACHEKAQTAARTAQLRRLADLAKDPEAGWKRVGELIANRTGVHYPDAVQILGDLATLADSDHTGDVFDQRYQRFRLAHTTKKALLRQLDAAGL